MKTQNFLTVPAELTVTAFLTIPALLWRKRWPLALAATSIALAGCGGGSSTVSGDSKFAGPATSTTSGSSPTSNAPGTALVSQFGPLMTRGTTTQNPVTEGASGAVTTGIAGNFSSMTLNYPTAASVTSRVYFARSQDGGSPFAIYSMNHDGTNLKGVVAIDGTLNGLSVSHDGTKLVNAAKYAVNNVSYQDIFIVNTDGTGQQNLTKQIGTNDYPSLSWDNKTVVFRSSRLNSRSGRPQHQPALWA